MERRIPLGVVLALSLDFFLFDEEEEQKEKREKKMGRNFIETRKTTALRLLEWRRKEKPESVYRDDSPGEKKENAREGGLSWRRACVQDCCCSPLALRPGK